MARMLASTDWAVMSVSSTREGHSRQAALGELEPFDLGGGDGFGAQELSREHLERTHGRAGRVHLAQRHFRVGDGLCHVGSEAEVLIGDRVGEVGVVGEALLRLSAAEGAEVCLPVPGDKLGQGSSKSKDLPRTFDMAGCPGWQGLSRGELRLCLRGC